jgi:hypothetical protein
MSSSLSINTLPADALFTPAVVNNNKQSEQPSQTASTTAEISPGYAVTISPKASQLLQQSKGLNELSKTELKAIYERTHSPSNFLFTVSKGINASGRDAKILAELPLDRSPERIAQAQKVAEYAFINHTTLSRSNNPYQDLSRDELCAIIYDETGNHTPAERYVAFGTRQHNDFVAFTELAKGIYVKDKTPLYQGLLDFFDALSPVERSQYPDDYRDRYVGFLKNAERERDMDAGSDL